MMVTKTREWSEALVKTATQTGKSLAERTRELQELLTKIVKRVYEKGFNDGWEVHP